jgi:hypothetical protein
MQPKIDQNRSETFPSSQAEDLRQARGPAREDLIDRLINENLARQRLAADQRSRDYCAHMFRSLQGKIEFRGMHYGGNSAN